MATSKGSNDRTPGALLRAARTEKKLTVTAAADALRTRETVIVALENDDYSLFSADMYARGFIRNYAHIVGLDAAPLLQAYQTSFAKNDPDIWTPPTGETQHVSLTAPPKNNLKSLLAIGALSVLVLVTVVSVVLGGRAPDTASVDDLVDVAPEPAPTPDTQLPPTDTAEEADDEPVMPATGVELLLIFEQASWMQIFVDEVLVLEETVRSGETLQYRGDEVRVRFGNAGGVFAELNGDDLGIQGERGEVKNVRYTRDGADLS